MTLWPVVKVPKMLKSAIFRQMNESVKKSIKYGAVIFLSLAINKEFEGVIYKKDDFGHTPHIIEENFEYKIITHPMIALHSGFTTSIVGIKLEK